MRTKAAKQAPLNQDAALWHHHSVPFGETIANSGSLRVQLESNFRHAMSLLLATNAGQTCLPCGGWCSLGELV